MKITYRYLMENKLSKDERVRPVSCAAFPRSGGKKINLIQPDKAKAFALLVKQQKEQI